MLVYIESFCTGAPDDSYTIDEVHYFYETSTNVMYVQCSYPHNLNLRDPAIPLVKPDGNYLTYQEWLATLDEGRNEREHVCEHECIKCEHISQTVLDLELER